MLIRIESTQYEVVICLVFRQIVYLSVSTSHGVDVHHLASLLIPRPAAVKLGGDESQSNMACL